MNRVLSRILRNGWYPSHEAVEDVCVCPRCGSETEIKITNDKLNEYNAGERCPQGCFKIVHNVAVED